MIFISHKTNPDHALAMRVASVLRDNGIACWLAPESVRPNADFAEEIPNAINSCEYFLLLLSKEAQESAHVRKEIGFAQEMGKSFIILKQGDFELSYKFRYLLDDCQFMQFDWDDPDFTELVELCHRGERVVSMETGGGGSNGSRKIFVVRGDFQDNMALMIHDHPEELPHTVFAMGIDRSSDLSISSKKGILRWVCAFLSSEYGVSVKDLQKRVDEAKVLQLGHVDGHQPMRYRDSVLIEVPLVGRGEQGPEAAASLQILLIANSEKGERYKDTHDVDDVRGIDSREIIIEVFNRCSRLGDKARNLFIGAMGTNGLLFPYEVVTAEIMNCFAYCGRNGIPPQNLYYSVRQEDMRMHGLTVDQLLEYVTMTVRFVR